MTRTMKLTIEIKSPWEAEQVVDALIRLEQPLRDAWLAKGDMRGLGLADRVHVARRKLQEESGLVAGIQRIEDLIQGKVKGISEAQFRRSIRKGAEHSKKRRDE
jgi:hypothetical protein